MQRKGERLSGSTPPGSVVTGEVMGGLGGGDIGGTDPGSLFSSATWRARRAARGGSRYRPAAAGTGTAEMSGIHGKGQRSGASLGRLNSGHHSA